MPAADLIRLVQTLQAPYGLERSVKITPGFLADDRCLISIGRAALGAAPLERLRSIGKELGMPAGFAKLLPDAFQRADIVHFGFEATANREVYKIYFEYSAAARSAMAARSQIPVLVHLAYKWAPLQPDSLAVTRYTWVPCRTRAQLETKLRALVQPDLAPRAFRCASSLLSQTSALADSGELLLMEVEEAGNPRRSCDLNVYDAQLRVRDIADLLTSTLTDFDVPPARSGPVFDLVADLSFGHLSAGVGRDSEEFVTIYFGIEGH